MQRSSSFASRAIPAPPAGGASPNGGGGRATMTNAGLGLSSFSMQRKQTISNGMGDQSFSNKQTRTNANAAASNGPIRFIPADLTFSETNQIRSVWAHSGKEYLRDVYSLRSLLGELGLFPMDEEMQLVLTTFEDKVSFNNFLRYVTYLKGCHAATATAKSDADTNRAFVALGGSESLTGDIAIETIREACKRFQLTVDVDEMLAAANINASREAVDYKEFKHMWELRHHRNSNVNNANGGIASAGNSMNPPNGNAAANGDNKQKDNITNLLLAANKIGANNNSDGAKLSLSPTKRSPTKGGAGGSKRRHESSISAADEDLEQMLVTGEESYDDGDGEEDDDLDQALKGSATPRSVFAPIAVSAGLGVGSTLGTPRSVLKSLAQPLFSPNADATVDDNIASGSVGGNASSAAAEHAAALRAFLLGTEMRRPDDNGENNAVNQPKRRASLKQRNMSRRYTSLPTIRNGGVLANAAAAEGATGNPSDGEVVGQDGEEPLTNISPNAADSRSAAQQQQQQQQSGQQEKTGGYRAPSPIILSEYTATRHRPEGNKLGLISPRGVASKGTSIGMTRHGNGPLSLTQPMGGPLPPAAASPTKKSNENSPMKSTPRRGQY